MKPVQVVLDEALLARLDRAARKRKVSRSAFIRETLETALGSVALERLVAAERASYERQPQTADEKAAHRALRAASSRAMQKLVEQDEW